uniref:ISL3 family transposase n=1 Tax=Allosalinactinospora lopnorensis TaxID=1352348 RepID=UPI0006970051|nr:ISL3 family transposase [Allosalinactinospora lopnorensis]
MSLSSLLTLLFPHLADLRIDDVYRTGSTVRIAAATRGEDAACPVCATRSRRVHSRYVRRLADTPVSGQEVMIHLGVRRLFCDEPACERRIFAEQVPGLTVPHARRSRGLSDVLAGIGMALGGRAGARLAARLAAAVSRMTLLRQVRAEREPEVSVPRMLGVDDFALHKGHVYGTLLVDAQTRRPVELLPERSAQALKKWLIQHPGVEVVCRDRAGCYADGIAQGAPGAVQVADWFHLWQNLAAAVERAVARHRREFPRTTSEPTPTAPPAESPPAESPGIRQGPLAERTRRRHRQIHDLLARGRTIMEIVGELGLARNTVRRFARAAAAEELLARDGTGKRPRRLQRYDSFPRERFAHGCTNAAVLWGELQQQGYGGSYASVRDYIRPWRSGVAPPPAPQQPPTVRQVTAWFLSHPNHLEQEQQLQLKAVLGACPELASLSERVQGFARMMAERQGHRLEEWTKATRGERIPELDSFVRGVGRGLGRRRGRADTTAQLRRGRRPRQPAQDAEAADVRARQARPAAQARVTRRLIGEEQDFIESVPEPTLERR